jgi:hypothetical protein
MAELADLSDEELAAVIAALRKVIDGDRYPLSPRLMPYKSALAELQPTKAVPPPPAPSRPVTVPSHGRCKRRG